MYISSTNKTQTLINLLEKEEQKIINYYSSRKQTEELTFVINQLKNWNGGGASK